MKVCDFKSSVLYNSDLKYGVFLGWAKLHIPSKGKLQKYSKLPPSPILENDGKASWRKQSSRTIVPLSKHIEFAIINSHIRLLFGANVYQSYLKARSCKIYLQHMPM